MATTPKRLAHTRIASAGTDVVDKQAAITTVCHRIVLFNTHTAEVKVDVYLLQDGETVSSDAVALDTLYIPAGKSDLALNAEGTTLDVSGDSLHIVASVNDVIDCNVFGVTV